MIYIKISFRIIILKLVSHNNKGMKLKVEELVYVIPEPRDELKIKSFLKILNGDTSKFKLKNFIIAKGVEKIIGCIRTKILSDGTLELSSLAVLPDYRNMGIGGKLIETLLLFNKNRPIFLLTSSEKEIFYKKFNFILVEADNLPGLFKEEYLRIKNLPFAKNIKVIAMVLK